MNKEYDTGKYIWKHGQVVEWHSNGNAARWLLGPCPHCGSVTSSYGGGFHCHEEYCRNNSSIFVCSTVDKTPNWWNTDMNVKLDGNKWCAFRDGFINLQESNAGFGDSPDEAVQSLEDLEPTTKPTDKDE